MGTVERKWEYELHIPKGSADGTWQVLDKENVIAIIDPHEAIQIPEEVCALVCAAPDGYRLAKMILERNDVADSVRKAAQDLIRKVEL